jgi:hypothetical protein
MLATAGVACSWRPLCNRSGRSTTARCSSLQLLLCMYSQLYSLCTAVSCTANASAVLVRIFNTVLSTSTTASCYCCWWSRVHRSDRVLCIPVAFALCINSISYSNCKHRCPAEQQQYANHSPAQTPDAVGLQGVMHKEQHVLHNVELMHLRVDTRSSQRSVHMQEIVLTTASAHTNSFTNSLAQAALAHRCSDSCS